MSKPNHKETLYSKGDMDRPKDDEKWSKGFDAINWDLKEDDPKGEDED
tara:strand:+ start:226 stop:369 length:144 start_codon:yes stop_codon:yes gene_type:complete